MTDAEDLERVADQLCEVTLALDDVDLNPLLADDARTLLDTRDELGEICRRYRQDAASARRLDEQRAEEDRDR